MFVSSIHWDEGTFSREEQGICSPVIDSILVDHKGGVLDEVISDGPFQVFLPRILFIVCAVSQSSA